MTYKYFMGIDMAKSSFHSCIYQQHNKLGSWEVDNNKQGLRKIEKLLKELKITNKDQALFCLEHTGIYNQSLLEWIVKKGYHLNEYNYRFNRLKEQEVIFDGLIGKMVNAEPVTIPELMRVA